MPLLTWIVPPADSGQRLDRWLTDQLSMRSRHEIKQWIEQRSVRLNGRVAKSSYKVEAGDEVRAEVPEESRETSILAEEIPLPILYEDDDLLVINKPAGLAVHPSPGHESGTVLNGVQYLLRHHGGGEGGGERRPGLVHRLDMETSGVLVITKNDRSLRQIQEQFKRRTVYKEYLALVEGSMHPVDGRISAPIGPHPTDSRRFTVLPGMYKWNDDKLVAGQDGKHAITDYWTVATYRAEAATSESTVPTYSLLRIELHTGRTHQIRVHLSWLKHAIVGDTLYGPSQPRLPITRQFLHAHKLRIRLPQRGREVEFVAPLPTDLQELVDSLAELHQ
ncbi:MAG: RluA family pseudouridine synthase [Caldilineaceae bacterium]